MDPKSSMIWKPDDVISVIRELARDGQYPAHLLDGEIAECDSVDTLGIDSIGGVYLVDRLEELTGVPMPDDLVPPGTDIRGIAARLNDIVGGSS
jgi:acyl carrier protein